MKSTRFVVRFGALLAILAFVVTAMPSAEMQVFEGEIADSQCAMNVHSLERSHKEMLATGKAGRTAADCTRYCVHERGGVYVLQTKHDVFKLSDQTTPEKFAGQKVKVTGTLDPKTNTIEVKEIVPLRGK